MCSFMRQEHVAAINKVLYCLCCPFNLLRHNILVCGVIYLGKY